MSAAARGLPTRLLALVALLAVVGLLAGGGATARHHHDAPGLYDDRCPLQALATFERAAQVVAALTAVAVTMVAALAVQLSVVCPARTPFASARLRAPPAR